MVGQANAAPVIIKRKKVVAAGGGHHGGAWKVAYADFVTAMMAFFLLMWLLNATTEKQRKGLSDYFNPTVPLNRVSGGGNDAFQGDTMFASDARVYNGTGGSSQMDQTADGSSEEERARKAAEAESLQKIEKLLIDRGGESRTMERLLRHVITRITDEGLVIELFDIEEVPLFRDETADPTATTVALASVLSEVLGLTENRLAVNGYLRTLPVTLANNPSWDLSADRAQTIRRLLDSTGIDPQRFQRIGGFADRKPAVADAGAIRNNRIEIVLLRSDR
ncbi:MAG: OmpA family protein [Rhodobacteraceae bacterium]|jgi:chemotaxis protein MotB|nr:OmpA family protein [Paracoccaceae bacterium]